MQDAVKLTRYVLKDSERLLAGLTDEHRAFEPAAGAKTAGWLVGHIAFTGDFARTLCGRPKMTPKGWGRIFGPGTAPSHDAADYPPMDELVSTLRAVYDDLIAAASSAGPDVLDAPHAFERALGAFPTARAFVTYLLTAHLAYHFGQLSGWRAAAGITRPAAASPQQV